MGVEKEGETETEGGRQTETETWRARSIAAMSKGAVSPDKIICFFSAAPGGDVPLTERGQASVRESVRVSVLILSRGKTHSMV